jgi:GntR family transcriptional regulator
MPGTSRANLYEQVADDLRKKISTGELAPGAQLPSEPELDTLYSVSRGTTRKALAQLASEGLTESRQGKGVFVRATESLLWHLSKFEGDGRPDTGGMDAWATEVAEQGHTPHQDVEVLLQPAPRQIASRLNVEPDVFVVLRRRIRYVDDTPAQLSSSWFPEDIARNTLLMRPGDVSVTGGILAHIGHPQAKARDEITPRMPTPNEAERLGLGPGTAVLEHIRTGYRADGRPIRVMVSLIPDTTTLIYELEM